MAEALIRKACDRCHAQKLSCKRLKRDKCERCDRLGTECKSSPSLRSKKQQQQQQQQQCPSPTEQTPRERRSPKRRRTGSDPTIVLPEAGGLAKGHLAVTPDPVLEIGDFNFNFEQLGLVGGEYLSHHGLPLVADHQTPSPRHNQPGAYTDSWDPRLASSDVYPLVAPESLLPQAADETSQAVVLQEASISCVSEHSSSGKRLCQRTRQRPRQIHLAARADTTPLVRDAPLIHWMAQLADLNARLLDLSSALPSHEVTQNGPLSGPPVDDKFRGSGFPIDEMFKLTRRVADVLEQPPPEPSEAIDGSDPGNAMFILSTYTRLLDMYQKVFSLVRVELSQTSSNTLFRFWKLPDVTVGSFAVESSPFLQMSLTIQLAEEFLERLRRLADRWSGVVGGSLFSDVVDISFQAFKEREEKLARHLVGLRGDIEALLDG